MTLFSPDDLKSVFPEATPDTLQDPAIVPYEEMAIAHVRSQEATGRIALTGGSKDAIGALLTDPALPEVGLANVDPAFAALATIARDRSVYLIDSIFNQTNLGGNFQPSLPPSLEKFDLDKLYKAYKGYEALGIESEVVFTPEGHPLDFWKKTYSAVRTMQDLINPDSPHKLKNQDDGDGLWVNSEVANNWDSLVATDSPAWTATVLPISPKPPLLNVDNGGKDQNLSIPAELVNIIHNILPNATGNLLEDLVHPTIETYLMTQALHIYEDREPLDKDTYTWLDGKFQVGQEAVAPLGDWRPDHGRVYLAWRKVGYRLGYLGVRPSVSETSNLNPGTS